MEKDNNEGLVEAKELAKYIINTSPRRMSNLELQKTMYFVELDYRKRTRQRLIKGEFEAWQYGPVVPSVYEEYRSYGSDLIERTGEKITPNADRGIIDPSIDRCAYKKAWELVEESHRINGAWREARDRGSTKMDENLIDEEAKKFGR